jgi:hypothetical protein
MRKIKGSSNYLKNQVMGNLAKAALSLILALITLLVEVYVVLFTGQFSVYKLGGFIFAVIPLVGFNYYLRKYNVYNGGWQGEKQVAKLLGSSLSDDYYLINNLYLRGGGGDIDHVVLAPGGVFVLETKNWSGKIFYQGDTWQRPDKRAFKGSPSQQVKNNTAKIKRIIDNSPMLPAHIWVEGIVVLTNRNATVNVKDPTVQVLRLKELPKYLAKHGDSRKLSAEQLEDIARRIVNTENF